MHPNTTKTHQNMSLGSNGVDRVRSLPKIRCDFVPRTFAFMFNPFCTKFCVVTKQIQNAPKQYETHQYYRFGSNGADRVCLLQKNPMRLYGTNLWLNSRVQPILHRVPCCNETLPNAPKHYEMLQNMSLVPMGWIECVLCEK